METLIKNVEGNFFRSVLGFDANALYLYYFGNKMPTGWYELLERKNGFRRATRHSKQAIQWLEYMMQCEIFILLMQKMLVRFV